MREHFVIDPLISKRQQLLLATQLCRMVLKVRCARYIFCVRDLPSVVQILLIFLLDAAFSIPTLCYAVVVGSASPILHTANTGFCASFTFLFPLHIPHPDTCTSCTFRTPFTCITSLHHHICPPWRTAGSGGCSSLSLLAATHVCSQPFHLAI
jgi:hypothetical protein